MTQEQTPTLKDRLRNLRDHLLTDLIERDTPLRLAVLAALAGEHLLLLGPPGTAKSELARRVRHSFRDANYFERLLTRFTVPEELFGPLSIKALEDDRYQRQVSGYLPAASVAFLDEIFKANSAILNSLLTILNEREFDNGTQRIQTPLICVIGASNELPDGEDMAALYDRFLLRCHVPRVSDDGFAKLLELRGQFKPQPQLDLQLSMQELTAIRDNARRVKVPGEVVELLKALRLHCIAQGIDVSERRWRKTQFLLQVAAYTDGRNEVSQWDCWLLQHCLWEKPEQRESIFDWYKVRVGAVAGSPQRFTKMVTAWEQTLTDDQRRYSHVCNEQGQPLYKGFDGAPVPTKVGKLRKYDKNGEPLYIASKGITNNPDKAGQGYTLIELKHLHAHRGHGFDDESYISNPEMWLTVKGDLPPVLESARYADSYLQSHQKQVSELQQELSYYNVSLDKQISSLADWLNKHLWIAPGFAPIAQNSLQELRRVHGQLDDRLRKVQDGIKGLPRSTK